MSRRIILAAAIGAALLSLTAAPAALAAGSITVTASSPASNPGQLQLEFTSTTAITGFTAHILTQHGTDVLDLPKSDFAENSSSATGSTWTITTPISTSQLTLGTYDVSIDAQDSGDSITGADAGPLAFLIQPTVTLSATPSNLTYSQPAATLSGSVSGLWPGGATGPLAGQNVEISGGPGGYSNTLVTDASGNFSVQLPQSFGGTFTASVQGGTLVSTTSAPVTVSANQVPTKLSVTVSTATASYGQKVTVNGTLSYNPGSGFVPLRGQPVDISDPGSPGLSAPVTSAQGTFSVTFTMLAPGGVTVTFNEVQSANSGIPLLAPAQYQASLNFTYPTTITQFSADLSTSGQLGVQGCLAIPGFPLDNETYLSTPVVIQYATGPSGPWQRLGTVQLTDPYATISCNPAEAGALFGGTLRVKLARAYYRAYFPGESNESYLASRSSPVLAWKYLTEISSLKLSATRIGHGGRLTFTGKLLQDTSGWRPYSHQTVLIVYRKPGSRTWYWIVKATTNSAGIFRATIKDTFTATWSAVYEGNSTHFNCGGREVKVTVT